jgi:hypothetical protein
MESCQEKRPNDSKARFFKNQYINLLTEILTDRHSKNNY